jgi:hypothetical protein
LNQAAVIREVVNSWRRLSPHGNSIYRESFIERTKEFLPPHRTGELNDIYVLEKV